jgi:hypothetical protein
VAVTITTSNPNHVSMTGQRFAGILFTILAS